jgi:hypothetical protein
MDLSEFVMTLTAGRRSRAVKIHFIHFREIYLARNRLPRMDAAYILPSRGPNIAKGRSAKHNEARSG